jgi:phosphoribosylformylglycinamidine synthase
VELPRGVSPFAGLFSESTARALVSLGGAHEQRFVALCGERGVPCQRLGVVDGLHPVLEVTGQFRLPLPELRRAWSATLRDRFET